MISNEMTSHNDACRRILRVVSPEADQSIGEQAIYAESKTEGVETEEVTCLPAYAPAFA